MRRDPEGPGLSDLAGVAGGGEGFGHSIVAATPKICFSRKERIGLGSRTACASEIRAATVFRAVSTAIRHSGLRTSVLSDSGGLLQNEIIRM